MPSAPEPAPRRWRRAFSTLGCPELDVAGVVALAARFGIRELELRSLSRRIDLPRLFAEVDPGLVATHRLLRDAGQRICVLDTSVRLLDGPAGMAALRADAALAQGLHAPYLRLFDGGDAAHPPADAAGWAPALELLAQWEDERRANGWTCTLLIETHDAFCTSAPVLDLMRRCPHPPGLLWDAHHTWRRGGEAPTATWQAVGHLVRHLHIKDNLPGAGLTYSPPGQGAFPLAEVLGLIERSGYDGAVALEWERHWHPELAALEEVLPAWCDPG